MRGVKNFIELPEPPEKKGERLNTHPKARRMLAGECQQSHLHRGMGPSQLRTKHER